MGLSGLVRAGVSASESLVGRYAEVLTKLNLQTRVSPEQYERVHLREGAKIGGSVTVDGVEVVVCDETSYMATGTYKALDACVTLARVAAVGFRAIVLSSGGNLNCAVAKYARNAGVRCYLFNPASTVYKLKAADFQGDCHLIAVDRPEREVKELATMFAQRYAILNVPDIRWRMAASALRAMYLLEAQEEHGGFDWLAQTVCAAYGPVGIYNCFSGLVRDDVVSKKRVPKLLALQQAANAPMVRAWKSSAREIADSHVCPIPEAYIEPGLYNTNPGMNYTRLFDLLHYFGGEIEAITREDYERLAPAVVELLSKAGIELDRVLDTGEIREKAPVITGVGILQAIERGLLKRGQKVIYMVTGGTRSKESLSSGPLEATVKVDADLSLEEWNRALGERFGLEVPEYVRKVDLLFPNE